MAWPALLVALLLAGCIAPNAGHDDGDPPTPSTSDAPRPDCPGHWHFMLHVRVRNESVPFDHPDFLSPGATELHWDTGTLVHVHPSATTPRCVPLWESLGALDVTLTESNLTLGGHHGRLAGVYAHDGGETTLLFVQEWNATWRPAVRGEALPHQLANGSRLLLSFGNLTAADVSWQQAAVPPIPPEYAPPQE